MLSKELLGDFEACAEIFIPVTIEAVSVFCNSKSVLLYFLSRANILIKLSGTFQACCDNCACYC